MKIRNGFVSNSSSSSFVIYGVSMYYDSDDYNTFLKKYFTTEDITKINSGDYMIEDLIDYTKLGLELFEDYEGELVYIGRSWSDINDDETGAQLKESVKSKLAEFSNFDTLDVTIQG